MEIWLDAFRDVTNSQTNKRSPKYVSRNLKLF